MSDNELPKIKPCPWCGCTNSLRVTQDPDAYHVVGCGDDDGCGALGPVAGQESVAIELWNRGASRAESDCFDGRAVVVLSADKYQTITFDYGDKRFEGWVRDRSKG